MCVYLNLVGVLYLNPMYTSVATPIFEGPSIFCSLFWGGLRSLNVSIPSLGGDHWRHGRRSDGAIQILFMSLLEGKGMESIRGVKQVGSSSSSSPPLSLSPHSFFPPFISTTPLSPSPLFPFPTRCSHGDCGPSSSPFSRPIR